MKRLCFRLRTLYVLTALVAAACWWVTRPTIVAEKFVHAVKALDFIEADQYFINSTDTFLVDYQTRYLGNSPKFDIRWSIKLKPRIRQELLAGRRTVFLTAVYARDGIGHSITWTIYATSRGIRADVSSGFTFIG